MIYEPNQIKKLINKMAALEKPYASIIFENAQELECERYDTAEHLRAIPENAGWQPIKSGDTWGGPFQSMWLKTQYTVPEELSGRKIVLCSDIDAFECMVFLQGKPSGLFNKDGDVQGGNHSIALVTQNAKTGETFDIALECYAGTPCLGTFPYHNYGREKMPDEDFTRTFKALNVCAIREDVSDFYFDLKAVNQLIATLDKDSLRYGEVLSALMDAFSEVCQYPIDVEEDVWRSAMHKAHEHLKKVLSVKNGPSAGKIGLVGHSHMDTAWLWTVDETKRKCARTYANALSLMDWYPEYTFIQSSALHGAWMRDLYPDIFEKMKERVADGRYEPNGAVWVECDCNVTGGESMVRQFLYGQRFTQKEFGYTSDSFWLPDTFGYNAAIPQIMKESGVKYFLTTKMEWNESNKFPYESFVWNGMDGTAVLVHLNRSHAWPDVNTAMHNYKIMPDKHASGTKLVSYGFGDGGGGPQYQMIEMSKRIEDLNGCPPAKHTTVSKFMNELEEVKDGLPVWSGELYLELHRGTLTMMHGIKRSNRLAENAIRNYEALTVMLGENADRDTLTDWWHTILKNQFHDILPGTCIPEVYDIAIPENYKTISEIQKASEDMLTKSSERDSGLTIANTLGWQRNGQIVIDGEEGIKGSAAQTFTDVNGKVKTASEAALAPLSVISFDTEKVKDGQKSAFTYDSKMLETPFAKVVFDENGAIESLYDKNNKRQIKRPGGQPLNTFYLAEDVPFTYDNWDIDPDIFLKLKPHMNLVSRKLVSEGPLQIRIESNYKIGQKSSLSQQMVFYSDTPRIDFETVLDWHEKHRLLKAGFDVDILSANLKSEMQFGHIDRPTHDNTSWDAAKGEVCNHKWSDLSESRFGVAILNDCKYGISCKGSDMMLSLIKSGLRPDPRGDEGVHEFTYSLLPHEGAFSAESVVRPAYEFNIKPVAVQGAAKQSKPLFEVDADNIIVEAIKPAEDTDGYVIRMYECERSAVPDAKITFSNAPKEVLLTNMLEEEKEKLAVKDGSVSVSFKPFEIKTFLVK